MSSHYNSQSSHFELCREGLTKFTKFVAFSTLATGHSRFGIIFIFSWSAYLSSCTYLHLIQCIILYVHDIRIIIDAYCLQLMLDVAKWDFFFRMLWNCWRRESSHDFLIASCCYVVPVLPLMTTYKRLGLCWRFRKRRTCLAMLTIVREWNGMLKLMIWQTKKFFCPLSRHSFSSEKIFEA